MFINEKNLAEIVMITGRMDGKFLSNNACGFEVNCGGSCSGWCDGDCYSACQSECDGGSM